MFQCEANVQGFMVIKCLDYSQLCDGHIDCVDAADEDACPCREDEFQCTSNGMCIAKDKRCDFERDCVDLSDEIGCGM